MISLDKTEFFIDVCDRHSKKLLYILDIVRPFMPVKEDTIETIPPYVDVALDAMRSRYANLQDKIEAKIMPLISSYLVESHQNLSTIDMLNLLERSEYIPSKDWWASFREIRNSISHDYPLDLELASRQHNEIFNKSTELIDFWYDLKPKFIKLINQR